MLTFKDCVCLAQARVIEGKRKKAHVCTIAFHQPTKNFVRLCLPFNSSQESRIRRWDNFSFVGQLDKNDTRKESVSFGKLLSVQGKVKEKDRPAIHRQVLAKYKHEAEYNEERESIGVLVFDKSTIRFKQKPLTEREKEYRELMSRKGLYFPSYKLYIWGKSPQFKGPFEKQLLQWDFFEAIRKGIDPLHEFKRFKEPYAIVGNIPWQRKSFMAVSILSAPLGFVKYAQEQQLTIN